MAEKSAHGGGTVKKFVDWVNADTGLPPLEERDHHHAGDSHGGHDEFGEEEGFEDFDMGYVEVDEADEELSSSRMLVDTLQGPGASRAPARESVAPNLLLKEGLKRVRSAHVLFRIFSLVLVLCIIVGLLITVASMPPSGVLDCPSNNEVYARYVERSIEETGATNIVAAIILDYRAFDTLGEIIVLFTAMTVIIILMRIASGKRNGELSGGEEDKEEASQPLVLKFAVSMAVPFLMMFGIYVLLNGHLSPGGGFSGGAIMGASLSLYAFAFGPENVRRLFSFKTFTYCSSIALLFYALAKGFDYGMGGGITKYIPVGKPGNLFSAGLIMPLNISIGIIVACTVYGLYALFSESEI